jgi:hypothetical protein
MMPDIKEVIGLLMRALGGGEVTQAEVLDLDFEADGELLAALNDAYIKLLEFAHDRELRSADHDLAERQRADLQRALNRITGLCDSAPSRSKL